MFSQHHLQYQAHCLSFVDVNKNVKFNVGRRFIWMKFNVGAGSFEQLEMSPRQRAVHRPLAPILAWKRRNLKVPKQQQTWKTWKTFTKSLIWKKHPDKIFQHWLILESMNWLLMFTFDPCCLILHHGWPTLSLKKNSKKEISNLFPCPVSTEQQEVTSCTEEKSCGKLNLQKIRESWRVSGKSGRAEEALKKKWESWKAVEKSQSWKVLRKVEAWRRWEK